MLIAVLLCLIAVGVVMWLVNQYIPMDAKFKQLLNIVAIIIVILWLLKVFGVVNYIKSAGL